MPHVIHSAAQRHPLRLFRKNVTLDPGEHVVGFVPADSRRDSFRGNTVGGEAVDDEVDVTLWISPSTLRDGVAEEADFLTAFHDDVCGSGGGEHGGGGDEELGRGAEDIHKARTLSQSSLQQQEGTSEASAGHHLTSRRRGRPFLARGILRRRVLPRRRLRTRRCRCRRGGGSCSMCCRRGYWRSRDSRAWSRCGRG